MTEKRNNWSREELILAFNLYCKIPFNQTVKTNPQIINLAKIIGRTPSSVAMKLGNFGRLDPELKKRGIKGLSRGSKGEIEIWEEFSQNWDNLVFESEKLLEQFNLAGYQTSSEIIFETEQIEMKQGISTERVVKVRLNQTFFRQALLSSYNSTCAITGINISDLLVASHIIPWSRDENNRLNPRNGILLNNLHDKAFDKGLITVTTEYKIKLSSKLNLYDKNWLNDYFLKHENQIIILPEKFVPDKKFLEFHNSEIFLR